MLEGGDWTPPSSLIRLDDRVYGLTVTETVTDLLARSS
jgi:hypothetical protein